MDEEWTQIEFIDIKSNKKFGEFEFKYLDDGSYKLMRMYSEPCKGGGIGRAALEMFQDIVGGQVVVSQNDGQVRDDGSHLTQDAPGFVNKMISEGFIYGYEGRGNEEDGFFD